MTVRAFSGNAAMKFRASGDQHFRCVLEGIGDDVPVSTRKAKLMGAAVLVEPRRGPGGWRSVIATPASGVIGLWQPKAR
jgi:predicted enzyme related to lactoylglutathione lyase